MEEYLEIMNAVPPSQLSVFPNPSKDYVIIQYNLEIENKVSVIEISNIKGVILNIVDITNKQDQMTIITQNWKSGIYIATLKIEGNTKESIKFTIVK